MEHFIGLDIHSKTSTFVVIDQQSRVVLQEKTITSERTLINFINKIPGRKNLVFEESSISQWAYLTLKDKVDNLIICNPSYLGKKVASKNDYNDAFHLANELRCGHVVNVFHEDSKLMEIRSIVSHYKDIVKEITASKNRYNSILRSEAITGTGRKVYQTSKEDILICPSKQFVARQLFNQIHSLEEIKKEYLVFFKESTKENKMIQNLVTIPGIKEVRAHIIAAIVCSAERFHNKHHFWSYSMLVKKTETSDGRIYAKKQPQGRRELKNVFMGAAMDILKTKGGLKKYHESLQARGKDDRICRRALARKIAAISLKILKDGTTYDDKMILTQLK